MVRRTGFTQSTLLTAVILILLAAAISCTEGNRVSTTSALDTVTESVADAASSDKTAGGGLETIIPAAAAPPRQIAAAGPAPTDLSIEFDGGNTVLSFTSTHPGDYNVDGVSDGMDVFPLAIHFGQTSGQEPGNECIDGNGDGTLNGLDIFLIAANFQKRTDGYDVYTDSAVDGSFSGAPLNTLPIAYIGCDGVTGLTVPSGDGSPLYYALRSWDANAMTHGDLSTPVLADPPPAAPSGVEIVNAENSVTISWNASQAVDFDHYTLERSLFSGGPYTEIVPGGLTDTEYTDLDVTTETDYYYVLSVVDNGDVQSPYSAEAHGHPSAPPATPTGIVVHNGDQEVSLDWDANPEPDFHHYRVLRGEAPGGPYTQASTAGWAQSNLTSDGLENEKDYWFVLSAIDEWGVESAPSADIPAHTSEAPVRPTNLKVANGDGWVSLTWNANTEPDMDHYEVWRNEILLGTYTLIHTTDGLVTEALDDTPTNEQDWYYRVTAVDEWGVASIPTLSSRGHPSDAPAPPQDVTGVRYENEMTVGLGWSENTEEDFEQYYVYRSETSGGPYTRVIGTLMLEPGFNDGPLPTGPINWYHVVTAVDEYGVESDWSDEVHTEFRWAVETPDTFETTGQWTRLVIDDAGRPFVSYYDATDFDLNFAWNDGSSWSWESVDGPDKVGRYPGLGLDGSGNPIVSYYDNSNQDLKVAWFNGSTWDVSTIEATGWIGMGSDLAVDSTGNPAISYWDGNNVAVKVARFNGTGWDTSTVKQVDVSHYTSITFDGSDNPIVAFYGNYNMAGGDLQVGWHNGTDWSVSTLESGDGYQSWVSIDVDSNHNPGIAYWLYEAGTLHYAGYNGSWSTETVDASAFVGSYNCLSFDAEDNPAISYYDQDNGTVKIAWNNGASWDIHSFGALAEIGLYTSIDFGPDGNPMLSYYDYINKDLKIATYR